METGFNIQSPKTNEQDHNTNVLIKIPTMIEPIKK